MCKKSIQKVRSYVADLDDNGNQIRHRMALIQASIDVMTTLDRRRHSGEGLCLECLPPSRLPLPAPRGEASSPPAAEGFQTDQTAAPLELERPLPGAERPLPGDGVLAVVAAGVCGALWEVRLVILAAAPPGCGDGWQMSPTALGWHVGMGDGNWPWPESGGGGHVGLYLGHGPGHDDVQMDGHGSTRSRRQ